LKIGTIMKRATTMVKVSCREEEEEEEDDEEQ
jgi:hypothetical protein